MMSAGDVYSCGVRRNGEAYCWGGNGDGMLGDGSTTSRQRPVRIHNTTTATPPFTDWVMVSTGYKHTCGLRTTGQIYCWGEGEEGKIGDGSTTDRTRPRLVSGGYTDWVTVGTGEENSCAMRANGTAWCWGLGDSSQIGDGLSANRNAPTAVVGP
jgi:alpha-tubulin suppressor-like RCC1 family protein